MYPLVVLAVAAFIVFIIYLAALLQAQAIFELRKLVNYVKKKKETTNVLVSTRMVVW